MPFSRVNPGGLRAATVADLFAQGWDAGSIARATARLDYDTIEGLTSAHEGSWQAWSRILRDHPRTLRFLTIPSRPSTLIVGYWQLLPLPPSAYNLAREGRLLDADLTTDHIRPLATRGRYDAYFSALCIRPDVLRATGFLALVNSLLEALAELAADGIFIGEVCANALTPRGLRLCRRLHFRLLSPHTDRGSVLVAQMADLLNRDRRLRFAPLRDAYAWAATLPHCPELARRAPPPPERAAAIGCSESQAARRRHGRPALALATKPG